MKFSQYFLKTTKTVSEEDKSASARLLKQGGFIRESVAGRYYFLPIGLRVQQKIMAVIKEEMDAIGAQEMITPILHPLELWKETNRTNTTGFELMKVKDRRGAEFALGGTAEEMFVDLVRQFTISYKDLPFHLYQFSPKFRDEMRARGGLLRVREFIMKDAYSFHADEKDFKREYEVMKEVYTRIFDRLGLKTDIVESDNGYIGGEYCHEFIVESEAGESKYFTTEDGSYSAHEDVAKFERISPNAGEAELPREDIHGENIVGVEELVKFLKIPAESTTKTLFYETDKGDLVAAAVNGIYDINEVKLLHAVGCTSLQLASPETIKNITGAEVGYAGIVDLPKGVRTILDLSLKGRKNLEMGCNKTNYHSVNINFGRDIAVPEKFYDIAMARPGDKSEGGSKLIEKKGIEVGNIFQLGYHYSTKMKGANYVADDGSDKPFYMGCYGIGVGRTMATIVEKYNDNKGIIWSELSAPFNVHLVDLAGDNAEVKKEAEGLYKRLTDKGVEVLWDDRDLRAGEKFADSDLIGIPHRVVVSAKTMSAGKLEYKARNKETAESMSEEELLKMIEKPEAR